MVTASQRSAPACHGAPRTPRATTTVVVATVGLALNIRAWILLGQHLHGRFGVPPDVHVLLMTLPLLVAAVTRLPVGVLTDRYGARVVFPVVSLVSGASTVCLGFAGSLPVAVVAGACAGVGGTAFVVGGALLSRTSSYGRRGLCLGVFSLAQAPSIALPAVARGLDYAGRPAAMTLGGALIVFAGVAACTLRDPPPTRRSGSIAAQCAEMVRLACGTSLSLLYALALGGVLVIAVFLPVYLWSAYQLTWVQALGVTGAFVALSGVARLAGGWWTDRRPTAGPLVVCYVIGGVLCVVAAVTCSHFWIMVPVIAAVGVCDGLAGGALLALIGKATRPDNAGAIMGVTGAVAALGALPSIVLAVVDPGTRSYVLEWAVLAASLFAAAAYVRRRGLTIGLGLAVRYEPEPSPAATTVAVLPAPAERYGAPALAARLAELAVSDDLVVVVGSDEPPPPSHQAYVLVAGLRNRLPRYQIVAVPVAPRPGAMGQLTTVLGELVQTGAVAVAVTPTAHLAAVTAEVSHSLHADRVLQVSYTRSRGAGTREIWNRATATATGGLQVIPAPN